MEVPQGTSMYPYWAQQEWMGQYQGWAQQEWPPHPGEFDGPMSFGDMDPWGHDSSVSENSSPRGMDRRGHRGFIDPISRRFTIIREPVPRGPRSIPSASVEWSNNIRGRGPRSSGPVGFSGRRNGPDYMQHTNPRRISAPRPRVMERPCPGQPRQYREPPRFDGPQEPIRFNGPSARPRGHSHDNWILHRIVGNEHHVRKVGQSSSDHIPVGELNKEANTNKRTTNPKSPMQPSYLEEQPRKEETSVFASKAELEEFEEEMLEEVKWNSAIEESKQIEWDQEHLNQLQKIGECQEVVTVTAGPSVNLTWTDQSTDGKLSETRAIPTVNNTTLGIKKIIQIQKDNEPGIQFQTRVDRPSETNATPASNTTTSQKDPLSTEESPVPAGKLPIKTQVTAGKLLETKVIPVVSPASSGIKQTMQIQEDQVTVNQLQKMDATSSDVSRVRAAEPPNITQATAEESLGTKAIPTVISATSGGRQGVENRKDHGLVSHPQKINAISTEANLGPAARIPMMTRAAADKPSETISIPTSSTTTVLSTEESPVPAAKLPKMTQANADKLLATEAILTVNGTTLGVKSEIKKDVELVKQSQRIDVTSSGVDLVLSAGMPKMSHAIVGKPSETKAIPTVEAMFGVEQKIEKVEEKVDKFQKMEMISSEENLVLPAGMPKMTQATADKPSETRAIPTVGATSGVQERIQTDKEKVNQFQKMVLADNMPKMRLIIGSGQSETEAIVAFGKNTSQRDTLRTDGCLVPAVRLPNKTLLTATDQTSASTLSGTKTIPAISTTTLQKNAMSIEESLVPTVKLTNKTQATTGMLLDTRSSLVPAAQLTKMTHAIAGKPSNTIVIPTFSKTAKGAKEGIPILKKQVPADRSRKMSTISSEEKLVPVKLPWVIQATTSKSSANKSIPITSTTTTLVVKQEIQIPKDKQLSIHSLKMDTICPEKKLVPEGQLPRMIQSTADKPSETNAIHTTNETTLAVEQRLQIGNSDREQVSLPHQKRNAISTVESLGAVAGKFAKSEVIHVASLTVAAKQEIDIKPAPFWPSKNGTFGNNSSSEQEDFNDGPIEIGRLHSIYSDSLLLHPPGECQDNKERDGDCRYGDCKEPKIDTHHDARERSPLRNSSLKETQEIRNSHGRSEDRGRKRSKGKDGLKTPPPDQSSDGSSKEDWRGSEPTLKNDNLPDHTYHREREPDETPSKLGNLTDGHTVKNECCNSDDGLGTVMDVIIPQPVGPSRKTAGCSNLSFAESKAVSKNGAVQDCQLPVTVTNRPATQRSNSCHRKSNNRAQSNSDDTSPVSDIQSSDTETSDRLTDSPDKISCTTGGEDTKSSSEHLTVAQHMAHSRTLPVSQEGPSLSDGEERPRDNWQVTHIPGPGKDSLGKLVITPPLSCVIPEGPSLFDGKEMVTSRPRDNWQVTHRPGPDSLGKLVIAPPLPCKSSKLVAERTSGIPSATDAYLVAGNKHGRGLSSTVAGNEETTPHSAGIVTPPDEQVSPPESTREPCPPITRTKVKPRQFLCQTRSSSRKPRRKKKKSSSRDSMRAGKKRKRKPAALVMPFPICKRVNKQGQEDGNEDHLTAIFRCKLCDRPCVGQENWIRHTKRHYMEWPEIM